MTDYRERAREIAHSNLSLKSRCEEMGKGWPTGHTAECNVLTNYITSAMEEADTQGEKRGQNMGQERAAGIVTEHYQGLSQEHRLLLVNRATAIRSLVKDGEGVTARPAGGLSLAINGQPDYEAAARFLFGLLDDIDTTGDMVKSNDAAYRAQVERIQKRRFEAARTDGYTVMFFARPTGEAGE